MKRLVSKRCAIAAVIAVAAAASGAGCGSSRYGEDVPCSTGSQVRSLPRSFAAGLGSSLVFDFKNQNVTAMASEGTAQFVALDSGRVVRLTPQPDGSRSAAELGKVARVPNSVAVDDTAIYALCGGDSGSLWTVARAAP